MTLFFVNIGINMTKNLVKRSRFSNIKIFLNDRKRLKITLKLHHNALEKNRLIPLEHEQNNFNCN